MQISFVSSSGLHVCDELNVYTYTLRYTVTNHSDFVYMSILGFDFTTSLRDYKLAPQLAKPLLEGILQNETPEKNITVGIVSKYVVQHL